MGIQTRQGSILIVVLLIVAGTGILLASLSKTILVDHISATAQNTTLASSAMFTGIPSVAALYLKENAAQKNEDTLHEPWANFSEETITISEALKSTDIEAEILDESANFPINELIYTKTEEKGLSDKYAVIFSRIINGLLEAHLPDSSENERSDYTNNFLNSIRYWGGTPGIKSNDDTEYYSVQKKRYKAPKRPLAAASELTLIRWKLPKGLKEKILYGDAGLPGLLELITVHSEGPMNINTLNEYLIPSLIQSTSEIREEFTQKILLYRTNPDNFLGGKWYRDQTFNMGINWSNEPEACISTQSSYYRLKTTYRQGQVTQKIEYVFKAEADKLTTLAVY